MPIPSTGEWVNWFAEDKENHRGQRVKDIYYDPEYDWWGYLDDYHGSFVAKVYDNGIKQINETSIGGGNYRTELGTSYSGLTNNHMYVIQISSTSDEYILGRPYVDPSSHQSQDDVVSPAFMIASQLGAVTIFTGDNGASNAAEHCSRYMEVTADGIYYTGWRLPTRAEISVITGYQWGNIDDVSIPESYRVLTPVLTGYRYWALNGTSVIANDGSHQGYTDVGDRNPAYLRCVRDLSADEVERLNAFDKIQEKYQ